MTQPLFQTLMTSKQCWPHDDTFLLPPSIKRVKWLMGLDFTRRSRPARSISTSAFGTSRRAFALAVTIHFVRAAALKFWLYQSLYECGIFGVFEAVLLTDY